MLKTAALPEQPNKIIYLIYGQRNWESKFTEFLHGKEKSSMNSSELRCTISTGCSRDSLLHCKGFCFSYCRCKFKLQQMGLEAVHLFHT